MTPSPVCVPEEIHALQLLAELQVGNASVGDRALPAHLKSPELRQVAQHGQPAVGDLATWIVAEIELLQSLQAREVRETVIGDLLRSAEVELRDVWQLAESREHAVGQLAPAFEAGDLLVRHHRQNLIPLPVLERMTDMQRAVRSLDAIQRQIPVPAPTACARQAPRKLHPAGESALVRDETASIVDRQFVALGLAQALCHTGAHLVPAEGALEEVTDALQGVGLARLVGHDDVARELLERFERVLGFVRVGSVVRVPPRSCATRRAP